MIEKDLIAGLLADGVNADQLIILTDVECVYKDFGKEKQEPIYMMDCETARKYIEEGQFGKGNMQPEDRDGSLFYRRFRFQERADYEAEQHQRRDPRAYRDCD